MPPIFPEMKTKFKIWPSLVNSNIWMDNKKDLVIALTKAELIFALLMWDKQMDLLCSGLFNRCYVSLDQIECDQFCVQTNHN